MPGQDGVPRGAGAMTPALSVWLDLCRVLAALAVYIGHSVYLKVAPPALSLTWHRSADDAVIAFFVISGLVIADTTRDRALSGGQYALARLSRVYSVALPAVLLALAIDLVGMRFNPGLYTPDWQYPRLWFYLPFHWLFLGETWFGAIQPFSMAPYWSLGYEVWYYVLFGVALFVRGRLRWVALIGVLVVMGPRIVLLLPVWLLGVWLQQRLPGVRLGPRAARALMGLAVVAYLVFFLSGLRGLTDEASRRAYVWFSQVLPMPFDPGSTVHVLSDYVVGLIFAGFVVGCARCEWDFRGVGARWIQRLAGFTFSFYLIHFTVLVLASALGLSQPGWGLYGALLMAVLAVTWALAQVGELRRGWYRACLLRLWSAGAGWRRERRPGAGA
jgi:peptidoglycan/LPS O-acetylase OafA/YrhL